MNRSGMMSEEEGWGNRSETRERERREKRVRVDVYLSTYAYLSE